MVGVPLEARGSAGASRCLQRAINSSHEAFQLLLRGKSVNVMSAVQGATDSSGHPIDRDFYKTFWGLQAVFQQPYSIIEPSAWAAATSSIHRVLAEFRKQVPYHLSCAFLLSLGETHLHIQAAKSFACSGGLVRYYTCRVPLYLVETAWLYWLQFFKCHCQPEAGSPCLCWLEAACVASA